MKVSVIIPVFNRERHIGAAIRSLLAQGAKADLDIIVADDGSGDGSIGVVEELAAGHRNIRLLRQAHGGVSSARNLGLRNLHPETELITFLDSDDVSAPGRFATELPLFRADPGLDLLYSKMTLTDRIDERAFAPQPGARTCTLRGISLCTALMRRRAVMAVGAFEERLEQAEDLDFLLRLFEGAIRFRLLDHVAILYRRHEGNLTRNRRDARRGLSLALLRSIRRRQQAGNPAPLPTMFFDLDDIEGDRELLSW